MWENLKQSIISALFGGFKKIGPALFRIFLPTLAAWVFWMTDGFWLFLGALWQLLPEQQQVSFAPFLALLNTGNSWFPLVEWFSIVISFYAFYLTFIAIRMVVRSIPTLA